MVWLIITLAVVLAALIPYSLGMQETTLMFGRKLSDEMLSEVTSDPPGRIKHRGLQDELTSRIQNLRNVLMYGLMIAVFGLITYQYAWYHGLWVLVVTMMVGRGMGALLGLKPGHPRFVAEIRADMQRRVVLFTTDGGDPGRASAMLFLIGRFDNLVRELGGDWKEPSLILVGRVLFQALLFPINIVLGFVAFTLWIFQAIADLVCIFLRALVIFPYRIPSLGWKMLFAVLLSPLSIVLVPIYLILRTFSTLAGLACILLREPAKLSKQISIVGVSGYIRYLFGFYIFMARTFVPNLKDAWQKSFGAKTWRTNVTKAQD